MEPRHERIARIALAVGARYGLALAGGYAVSAHGMGNRPSGDVDLFTSWPRRGEFDRLLSADALGALTRITDAAFAEYHTDPSVIADMRHRFADWRRDLVAAGLS
jgi:hypothetical protein